MWFYTVIYNTFSKNKSVDLSDINNYRAIAISPALSKLFEVTLESHIKTDSVTYVTVTS